MLAPMKVTTLTGRVWELEDVQRKLSRRAGLPGARVYDLSANALRLAKEKGLSDEDRYPLALSGSWLVNSPAQSLVFRRWALDPQRPVMLEVLSLFDPPSLGPLDHDTAATLKLCVAALGSEPTIVEALSKVLALLVPHAIPLMPPLAVAFVMGAREPAAPADGDTFVAMASWFGEAVEEHWDALTACAAEHKEVPLDAAQVLDRMLWFDSDGFKHWAAAAKKNEV
jgi:hypothetical protein